MKMPDISLTDFVDFVSKVGTPRLTKVNEIKNRGDYDPAQDFYKSLREGLQDYHAKGYPRSYLDAIIQAQTDGKKLKVYPSRVVGYKKFLGKKDIVWFAPPSTYWTRSTLRVRINPELGLHIKGVPHLIKLYFKSDALAKNRVDVITHLMFTTLNGQAGNGVVMGVLDVVNGKLITPTVPIAGLDILLSGEADAFIGMWQAL